MSATTLGISPIAFRDAEAINADIFSSNKTEAQTGVDFSKWLSEQLNELDTQIKTAETGLQHLATGEANNIHQVMLDLGKAKMSMELVVEVRNRMLEGYQEIMRMQI